MTDDFAVGDIVKTKTGKTHWIIEELGVHYAGIPYARVTKLESNGETPRYVNTSLDLDKLIMVAQVSL